MIRYQVYVVNGKPKCHKIKLTKRNKHEHTYKSDTVIVWPETMIGLSRRATNSQSMNIDKAVIDLVTRKSQKEAWDFYSENLLNERVELMRKLNQIDKFARHVNSDDSLLTDQEHKVINSLVDAWNAFVELEELHPDEKHDFRKSIHEAQRNIMARPVRREFKS